MNPLKSTSNTACRVMNCSEAHGTLTRFGWLPAQSLCISRQKQKLKPKICSVDETAAHRACKQSMLALHGFRKTYNHVDESHTSLSVEDRGNGPSVRIILQQPVPSFLLKSTQEAEDDHVKQQQELLHNQHQACMLHEEKKKKKNFFETCQAYSLHNHT